MTSGVGIRHFFPVAKQDFRRILKVFEPMLVESEPDIVTYHFDPFMAPVVKAALPKLRTRLRTVMEAKLTPRQVTQALNITSKERLRWTKDGRLIEAGRLISDLNAAKVAVPLYDMRQILQLISQPEIIAGWRTADD